MAAYSTDLSSFTFNSVTYDGVGSFSISISAPPFDVTQVGSANAYSIAGTMSTAISLDIYYTKAQHVTLTTSLLAGSSAAFTLTAAAGDVITGTARVVGCDIVGSNQDIVRASVTLQVTGPISINGTSAYTGVNEI
jgi:hypothetical protein